MEQEITFNEIPAILGTINRRLSRIEQTIQPPADPAPRRRMMTLDELLGYLPYKVKKETIYTWRHQGRIPSHKQGGNLVFFSDEIDEWIVSGGCKSEQQMIAEAQDYTARVLAGIRPRSKKGGNKR